MPKLTRRLAPLLVDAATGPGLRSARRWLAERRRRLGRAPHRVDYFHQADDPYSHLLSQVLEDLALHYDVELVCHLVGPPSDAAAPDRDRLEVFARRDAADVAPGYGLVFRGGEDPPDPSCVRLAQRILAGAVASGDFVQPAVVVGDALWRGDRGRLEELAAELPAASENDARAAIQEGDRLRERRGHYLSAMLLYGGEWYWGVDRLHHLERRLQGLDALRAGVEPGLLAPRPDFSAVHAPDAEPRQVLEVYPSLRSPYTAIVMERVLALPGRLPVELVMRPVLPMVMRGLPVPRAKQLYIVTDTRREAEDAGVRFGRVCDPVGRPVERGFSLYPWAREQGKGAEYLCSFTRAAFGEGIDTGTDAGLRVVVERIGLSFESALPHLDSDGWQPELEANRKELLSLDLWGVPSFRLLGRDGAPDYATWGQDRLWRVEQEILRRAGHPQAG